ncbi:MAG: hypothetical protein HY858_12570 [Candidatus Solibacter usitatus]|nr:hypothetical protein [Candidatus Solibacter usitatus]
MRGANRRDGDELLALDRGGLRYFPVVPGRVEFAVAVRREILARRPQVVAVELPGWLEPLYRQAVARLPELSVICYPEDEESDRGIYVVVEPADPFVEALRSAWETGAEVLFLEPDAIDRPHMPDLYPDTHALRTMGYDGYVEAYRVHPQPRNDETADHAAAMAWRLQGADPDRRVMVVLSLNLLDSVLDAMERPQEPPKRRKLQTADLVNPHPDCLAEIAQEYPYLQECYEVYRSLMGPDEMISRPRVQYQLLKQAEENYRAQTGDEIAHWQRRMMARYTRNLAMVENQLTAGLFDLTVAARSIVDDNYAWEVWHAANSFTWQRDRGELETVNLSAGEVFLRSRKLRLRRRLKRKKQQLMPHGLKRRRVEQRQGEWAEQINGESICSYPPEDVVIEDYGKLLRQKARSMLSEERVRVEPFTTSTLDGIDIRETIRNWHEGKIFVRKFERHSGDVGAVVVIFDEDRGDRFGYLTTWLGEHQNESDMAFYSTEPFEHMVGPGIGRAEYGGFLMALPPRRMFDVWSDPDYDFAETKAERLLMAGLDYSVERHVVYVAARPPRTIFRSIAAHLNRQIVYIPMGQVSAPKLKKVRVVHVLDSHQRREIAKDYLW